MKTIKLLTPYPIGTTVTIARVNKYGHRVDAIEHKKTVGVNGIVAIDLEIPQNDDHYIIINEDIEDFFWISEDSNEIDLTLSANKLSLPTFLTHSLEDSTTNANRVLTMQWCAYPLESAEDKRFICRYGDLMDGQDKQICPIDNELNKRYQEAKDENK